MADVDERGSVLRTVADRYVILPQLGREGGASTVVKATDGETGRQVAVKLIPRVDTDRTHRVFFRREVEALGRLSHPNIVSLLDYGEDDGEDAFYLVFPWLEQGLREVLPPGDEIGWDDFADRWALPLADALAYAHERDVVHRDVKPANILVNDEGEPLLADFGISKIRSRMVTEATVAEFTSRPYAPPELDEMSSAARDTWGFATTVLRCLSTGPFTDYPHITAALADIDVPRDVEALLRRCTSRNRQDRLPNAITLRGELREIQNRRNRKWITQRAAQLTIRDAAARKLAPPPFDQDAEALERALRAEFAHGSHLARFFDPSLGRRVSDTFDLVGEHRRLRLAIAPGNLSFIVTKQINADESALHRIRRHGWPVAEEVLWTSHRQPPAEARRSMEMVLAALDEHYTRVDEADQLRDENRVFDVWLDLLDAKDDLEHARSGPLRYRSAEIDGKRVRFSLDKAPDSEIVGQERLCRPLDPDARDDRAAGSGVVVAQQGKIVILAFPERPTAVPRTGDLVLDTRASRAALRRQREAVVNVRSGIAVRPQLRDLLVDPRRIAAPNVRAEPTWFNETLDDDKHIAVTRALASPDFFLLEGPPGTGKTGFITELVRQELHRNPEARILLVSQTHVAVDNALVRLADAGLEDLVRLGKTGDDRIAEPAQRHLLDHRMPLWVAEIRANAERHLAQLAADASVELTDVQGTGALLELVAALNDLATATAKLADLTGNQAHPRPTLPAEADENDATSDADTLREQMTRHSTRIQELRERAGSLLGPAKIDSLLPPDADLTAAAVRAAVRSLTEEIPRLGRLADILTLQGEWFQRIESSRDLEGVLLHQARVVAGTCIGFMAHPAVRDLEFDLCILDEASKATATETLVPLARSTRWVLVGDPKQLPPMHEEVLDHEDLMRRHDLERADVERTLFQDLLLSAPEAARHQLTRQYRMHPGIGDLVSACFYEGALHSAAKPELRGWDRLFKPVTWLDTTPSSTRRETRNGTSMVNHYETQVIKRALTELRSALQNATVSTGDGRALRVLVLTAYRKQMEELHRAVAGLGSPLLDIEVNTVDAVQGRESDVTFFSVVRSNDRGELGFLGQRHWRRINVALSRSRFGLVIVGDAAFCDNAPGPLRTVLTHIRKHAKTCRIGAART
ncbi:AAA domain-containing protein [Amycolatopsis sp. NPDC059021]|uniref:bifunctional serine/threonine-protein kinase/DEAD/DEAH box helicase n=1 Tax=Amycolatopsis sp. NPDC059021 TaxID=3346704 RepID=UPI00366B800B